MNFESLTIQQLRDLTQKAYNKQKMASKKGNKTATLLNSVNKDASLALDDTQLHHNTRVLHQEHRESVYFKRADENLQALDGRRGLPLQAAAPCGQSCMAIACLTGGISTYPWAAPPSRVVRTEEALGLFRAEKGALQDLVTSSCTAREERNRRRLPAICLRPQEPIIQP